MSNGKGDKDNRRPNFAARRRRWPSDMDRKFKERGRKTR